jgi:hypothetical protein
VLDVGAELHVHARVEGWEDDAGGPLAVVAMAGAGADGASYVEGRMRVVVGG